jgi:hypothetical protein
MPIERRHRKSRALSLGPGGRRQRARRSVAIMSIGRGRVCRKLSQELRGELFEVACFDPSRTAARPALERLNTVESSFYDRLASTVL